jgi:hypothetical protein
LSKTSVSSKKFSRISSYILQVSEVDSEGRLIRIYGCGQFADGPHLQIDSMHYIVLDGDNRAFVADSANRRVMVMTGQPPTERVLLTVEFEKIARDAYSRMCYLPEKGQLLVVMTLVRSLAIYNVAQPMIL